MLTLSKKLLLVTAMSATVLLSACSEPKAKEDETVKEEFAIPVMVANIERNDISSNFHTTATLESRNEADIITRVTGIIEELTIEEGDFVEKGQVLARIDPRRYELALAKADAELAGINQELQRLSLMAEKQLVSAQASDKLKYQHQGAVAARELAALDLKDSQIVAPISGYISKRFVKAGHFTQGYQKLFHIVDQSSLQAVVYLPEHQLSHVKLQQRALLSFSARQGKQFMAEVRSISPVIDSRSGTFKVILSLDNSSLELKPGMFAQIALTFDTHENTLTIPSDAIITLDNQSKVYLVKDNKAVEVVIEKGFVQEQITEISGELQEGDIVVVNGQHNLKADALVEVLNGKSEEGSLSDEVVKESDTAIAKAGK
ncbi:efflux RND transporter periplasmic adaptor subunit [Litorilituus lipolyticus]|uniref:Efflux RND transporter periplasmic adaptor subunit n=1 Tax=Litorilituus lipolyticus TaxID=2491017 RepID=A0A502KUD4_9GAMM|nr:efflux RND transporter periplasmic adaptor subunit [Litorilituus lipolyticus]TPH15106.1 efflux RND transporter periplasmic adaptor subunit [Litorilituus lipolyticus]